MRVLIAAGGTAGHINPALAIAGAIKKADPSAEIHFAGRKEGMEYRPQISFMRKMASFSPEKMDR